MVIWPLFGVLVLSLMGTPGHATEEGQGDRGKDPARAVEPKKKEADARPETNGKQPSEKPAAEEKAKAAEEKAKEDKAKDEKAKPEDKAKAEDAKPEEPSKKPVTSLNLAIKLALMADPQLFPLDIEVEMEKNKATLTGSVPTEEEKAKVAEIAGKVDGVEAVVNKLTVTPALKDKLAKKQDESIAHVVRDRLSRSETLKAVGFDVKSENGIVYLSGKTRFQVIALEAAEAARQVPGVRAVDTAGVQLVAKD
jgi:hyperosmotically inducible protein